MAIESYIADVDQPLKSFQAVREFTDREEYRASFWRKYGEIQQDMTHRLEERRVRVLTYYGYGGIGKSSLARKLCSEMEEHPSNPIYALYDFKKSQDPIQVLSEIHASLTQKGKFTFPLFEYGLYFYAQKTGGTASSPEVQTVLDQSTPLKLFFLVAKCIPVASNIASVAETAITAACNIAGNAENILSLADEGVKAIRNHVLESQRKKIELDQMSKDELDRYLPQLFIIDMQRNLRKCKRPVVILLDTYEALVNEVAHGKSYLEHDKWLRSTEDGKKGIIVGTPGVLWVITGREKLKWPAAWNGTLEQHVLGSLSVLDTKLFLRKCGILDEALQDGLWDLTDGFPLYLDLCVKCHDEILKQNMTPNLSHFGQDTTELVARFMSYTSDAQQDNIYMLACLHHWTDNLIAEIGSKIISNFSASTYGTVMGLSIVDTSNSNYYYIHQVVEEILSEDCPPLIRNAVGNALLDKFLPILQIEKYAVHEYAEALFYAMRGAILRYRNRTELFSFYTENIRTPLLDFISAGHLLHAKPAVDLLNAITGADFTDLLYVAGLELRFHFASADGNYADAYELAAELLEWSIKLLGEDHPDTICAMHNLPCLLEALEEHQLAHDLFEIFLEDLRFFIDDEDHSFIQIVKYNLAVTLVALRHHEKARDLLTAVLDKDFVYADWALHLFGRTLMNMGQYQEVHDYFKTFLENDNGKNPSSTFIANLNLANALEALGRYQEASVYTKSYQAYARRYIQQRETAK